MVWQQRFQSVQDPEAERKEYGTAWPVFCHFLATWVAQARQWQSEVAANSQERFPEYLGSCHIVSGPRESNEALWKGESGSPSISRECRQGQNPSEREAGSRQELQVGQWEWSIQRAGHDELLVCRKCRKNHKAADQAWVCLSVSPWPEILNDLSHEIPFTENKQTNKTKHNFSGPSFKICLSYCWVQCTHRHTHNMCTHTYTCFKLAHSYYSSLSKHCIPYAGQFLDFSVIESDPDTHMDSAIQDCFKSNSESSKSWSLLRVACVSTLKQKIQGEQRWPRDCKDRDEYLSSCVVLSCYVPICGLCLKFKTGK